MRKFSAIGLPSVFTPRYSFEQYVNDGVNYPYQIFTGVFDSTTQISLPNPTKDIRNSSFSPNYARISFTAAPASTNVGYALYVMLYDGTGILQLTTDEVNMPDWHPDSSKIVFCSGSPSKVEVININGTGRTVLHTPIGGTVYNASYNYDGTKIAFIRLGSGAGELWVMDSDGNNVTLIKSGVGGYGGTSSESAENAYDWANLSNVIAYQSIDATSRINKINSNGYGDTVIFAGGTFINLTAMRRHVWLPDDSALIVTKYIDNTLGWQLWKVPSNGSTSSGLAALYTGGNTYHQPVVYATKIYFIKFVKFPSVVRTLTSVDLNGTNERAELVDTTNFHLAPN